MFSSKDLEVYVARANSALELKFVWTQEDVLDESLAFKPQFTHQVFGEKEAIFGYKDLKIKLYYTPDTLHTYLALDYEEKIDAVRNDGMKADNVVKTLSEFVPQGYSSNLDEYLTRISKPRDFRPHGELLHVYTRDDITYEVYKADMMCPGFGDYHEKLQTFLMWFVDASSFIDIDDDKWKFYLVYEKRVVSGRPSFSIVGYTTVYSFYAYPDKIRPRLSQMLILPPFQRKGHGAQLLQSIYDDLVPHPQVCDMTVEDPSDEFRALRDFVDCSNALKLGCLQLHKAFDESAKKVRAKLKLQKDQAVRVCEILRLQVTNRTDSQQYQAYRLAVKNRLNGPYQKEQKSLVKLQKIVDPLELAMTHPQMSHEDHVTQLHQAYEQLEGDYTKIIEKLAGASPES